MPVVRVMYRIAAMIVPIPVIITQLLSSMCWDSREE